MKNTDLRIGNLVLDRGNKVLRIDYWERHNMIAQEIKVEGIGEVHPLTEEIEYLQPIPITEEWLLKFGFEEQDRVFHNQIALYKGNECFNYNASFFEHDNFVSIEYVHQLQNLYFALTGEELILKL